MKLRLSNKLIEHKRQVTSFLDVVGNVGGFNDAVYITMSLLISFYSSQMYMQSLTNGSPVREKISKKSET